MWNGMNKPLILLSHLLWWISTIPGWLRYRCACKNPEKTQRLILKKILQQNAISAFGQKHQFQQILSYEDYSHLPLQTDEDLIPYIEQLKKGAAQQLTTESPILLEPTGGSSGGTKLIPYTRTLKAQFQQAIDPWIFTLFKTFPSLLFGRHYWSITPSTQYHDESVIPIGFDSDAGYLGLLQQQIANRIFAVPAIIKECNDPATSEFITLLFLLNAADLRLISVWHPSRLSLLLKMLQERFNELTFTLQTGELPNDIHPSGLLRMAIPNNNRRAATIRRIGFVPHKLWPKLRLISCWAGSNHTQWTDPLKTLFPSAYIQPKGLIATEGITSIPIGCSPDQLAINSHFFEFECEKTKTVFPLWKIETGNSYHLLLTTGGGLYRYKTHDSVRITDMKNGLPTIQFLTRNNFTSDLVGEKISLEQAEAICRNIPAQHSFAFIAPEIYNNQFRYALYIDLQEQTSLQKLQSFLETELLKNYHYAHARNLRQLAPSEVYPVENLAQKTLIHLARKGQQMGGIKLMSLCLQLDCNQIDDTKPSFSTPAEAQAKHHRSQTAFHPSEHSRCPRFQA
jgi:hypothetical protein